MKKRFAAIFLLLCIVLSTVACAASPVGVTIDGTALVFTEASGAPFIDSHSRTLVPLRAVMEAYGCTVGWDQDTRTAEVSLGDTDVSVPVGKSVITVNGAEQKIDTAAVIKNGRTYLPIRAVLEAFGAKVSWDGKSRTVIVLHPDGKAPEKTPEAQSGKLEVHFLDVGQADCILLKQGSHAMLIDAGDSKSGSTILSYLNAQGVKQLDAAVGTHPHEDHIGSLDTVIRNIFIGKLYMPKVQTNTKTFEDVLDAALDRGMSITAPQVGERFSLGSAEVCFVGAMQTDDLNNSSLMLRVKFGKNTLLFTGDAEAEAEAKALASGNSLKSDVLKVGHHGSSSSSSEAFLNAVSPSCAVISCGADNSYGHPHEETLEKLAQRKISVFRTDLQGTIVAECDGNAIIWNTQPAKSAAKVSAKDVSYVLNTGTKKFHLPSCKSVSDIKPENKQSSALSRDALIAQGYAPCKNCNP